MLCELRVKNLALIESLELSFEQSSEGGLVVMTGETGAGKSIMLRAIHLLSGGRTSSDWIRSGEESCEVEALFEIKPEHANLLKKLEDGGFGSEPSLVIKRILTSAGRSRFYINGSFATAKIVAGLTGELLNVASQHDHQQLLQSALHLDYLDTIGDHLEERSLVKGQYQKWLSKKEELDQLKLKEREKEQRQDFLKFQVAEIREASLEVGEEELLAVEKKRLKNAQALIKLSQASYKLLSYDLSDGLTALRQNVTQLAELDPGVVKLAEEISSFTFMAEDYVGELRAYKDNLEADPYRLDQVNERLDLLQQFKRKFGETIEQILQFADSGEAELQQLENMEKEIAALEVEVQTLEKEMCKAAGNLSSRRQATASKLEKSMAGELRSLAFDKPSFKVEWAEVAQIPETMRGSGWDKGEFYFSANLGESPKPLAKIASGGELSRLMLAMKCLLAKKDMVETVIFDEVDSGIGGEAAEAVARKIQELASHHQVFCITHLPQIAARGNIHFQVAKGVQEGRTQTRVLRLSEDQRVFEIVRMLAGDSATEQTQAWAKDLLAKGVEVC
ncbi:MAG: DNA repair protein RecN (Recombination protein N) [Desulforhopalus sp.]|jgi:DNA repair protein RecN (Recombination protein N)